MTILPHPALLQRFEGKVRRLQETLIDEAVRGEAAAIVATLIESVMICLAGESGVNPAGCVHLRFCATTPVGVWLPLDEGGGTSYAANENSPLARARGLYELGWLRGQDLNL